MKPIQKNKSNYIFFKDYATRWRDNDAYGHMNNVVFYEFVDSIAVNISENSELLDELTTRIKNTRS